VDVLDCCFVVVSIKFFLFAMVDCEDAMDKNRMLQHLILAY
jgi:hypothetical protein